MCGIAGYFGKKTLSEDRLRLCFERMHRRGPDAKGHFTRTDSVGNHIYLLHSRLKIIDLDDRANQPFVEAQGSLIFNGEIYNYVELREFMQRKGVSLRTQSDTEVLSKILHTDGVDGLDACEGMWAFAFYDGQNLLLGRDRFGEKPLYILRENGGIYFGSEIKFLVALSGRKLKPNYDHLCRYLVNGYKALHKASSSFYDEIESVPAGTAVSVNAGLKISERRYWTPGVKQDDTMTYEQAVQGAREKVLHAVQIRLRADVPLAFCMSGGVDSNTLIGVAKNIFQYDVHGYTIVHNDPRYDENEAVLCSVKELGIKHTRVPLDKHNFLNKLRTLVHQHDAPVYTISYFVHWLLMEEIGRCGYKISLSGTGADELFSGYYDHHLLYLREVYAQRSLFDGAKAAWEKHIKPITTNRFLSNPFLFVESPQFRDHIYLDAERYASHLKVVWSDPFKESVFTEDLLRNRMLNELFYESIPVILHEDDLNAMYFSIENRSPFLDRDLFEFCYRIPTRHLIRDGFAKSVLRDAMKGVVPDSILRDRKKVGFNAPVEDLLAVSDKSVRVELMKDSPIFEWVEREQIEKLLDQGRYSNSESKFLFNFLSAKMFLESF